MPSRSLLLGCRRFLPLGGGGGGGGGSRTLSYASPFQHQRAPPSVPGPPPVPTSPFPSAAALWGGSASATWPPPAPPPPPPPPSYQPPRPYNPMVSYLIRACGFSFDEATEASEILAGKKSTPNPASSASSARGRSPLETQIGWLVSSAPPSPGGGGGNYGAIGDVGFSGRTLAQLMLLDPGVLTGADASRKIGFWCALFRAEADLMQALESNTHTLGSGPKETVVKKMILLQGCGMPNRELRKLLRNESKAVARSADSLEALIKRVEELGLARGRQAAYQYALQAIGTLAKKKLEHKLGAICRDVGQGEPMTPQLVGNSIFQLSPMDAGKAMDSSFKEARMETSNSPAHSIPLALSLEKKMMPPYYLLQILKSKDYLDENRASYILRMCKKARFWTNSYASVNREFRSFMKLSSLLVQGRIAV